MPISSSLRHTHLALLSGLLAFCLVACGGAPSCCDAQPISESLAPVRNAELTPLAADPMALAGRVGRSGGTASQVVMEFDSTLGFGAGGTYIDAATLSFYVSAVVGDPQTAFGMLRVELVQPADPLQPGSGLGDPIGIADYNDAGNAVLQEVAVPAGRGLIQLDVTDALQQHTGGKIAFRITFASASSAGPDLLVLIALSIVSPDPAPLLNVEGGILGY